MGFTVLPYLTRIGELAELLQGPTLSQNQICRVLIGRTFLEIEPHSIMFTELTNTGVLQVTGHFGIAEDQLRQSNHVPLSAMIPVTDAIRNHKLVWLTRDLPNWAEDYPDVAKYGESETWKTNIVFPTVRNSITSGAISIYSDLEITPQPELEAFIMAVGSLVSLTLQRLTKSEFIETLPAPGHQNMEKLSSRQKLILQLMGEGLTNAEIANQLAYSHSTIRQESIRIFAALEVSNREEAAGLHAKFVRKQRPL